MRRPILSPDTEQDLDNIKAYLTKQDGKQAARYVLSAIKEGIKFWGKHREPGIFKKI